MTVSSLEYLVTCACGDITYHARFDFHGRPSIDSADVIEHPDARKNFAATWEADDFIVDNIGECSECSSGYAHAVVRHWLHPDDLTAALTRYAGGHWYGYSPPANTTAGQATIRAQIAAGDGEPTFAWRIDHPSGTVLLPRDNPTDDELGTLAALIIEHGPTAATILAGLVTAPDMPLPGPIATTIDTLT